MNTLSSADTFPYYHLLESKMQQIDEKMTLIPDL